MSRDFIRFILLLSSLQLIRAQNDDNKNVEWAQDDPRWDKIPNWWDEETFQPAVGPVGERSQRFWVNQGQSLLNQKIQQKLNLNKAKNIVILIGDGMGLGTLMATRSYIKDVNTELSFDKFPHVGLAKTYCINYQVADSACSGTAILSGVKNNYGTIGVDGNVNLINCTAQRHNKTHVDTIFKFAQDAGKATGIITTTRVTHATPAAAYAQSASRYWESNENTPEGCDDIAHQLIHGETGSRLDVVMGGGRGHFLPNISRAGFRSDNRDLIKEFVNLNDVKGNRARVIFNRSELFDVDADKTDKVFGLFAASHMEYKMLSDAEVQPTLVEMTAKALEILKKNDKGFVLLIEGGRIDTAHHETRAKLALEETVEFDKTVKYVKSNTDDDDTLIVVTADHSTVLTVGGYTPRGFNILGPGDYSRFDDKWFFTLSYANGPGYSDHTNPEGGRQNPRGKAYLDPLFRQPTTVPEEEETHAGEDVGVYASGPFSHMFSGVYEQSYIAHALMYASCLGPDHFTKNPQCSGSSVAIRNSLWLLTIVIIITILNSFSYFKYLRN